MPTTPVGEVRLCSAVSQACGITQVAYRKGHVAEGYAQIAGHVGV
jgi:hypothetical protein